MKTVIDNTNQLVKLCSNKTVFAKTALVKAPVLMHGKKTFFYPLK